MKVMIAMDSFKNSISSIKSGEIIAEEFQKFENCENIEVFPFADGGEGSIDALIEGRGERIELKVNDPLHRIIDSYYGILEDTAFIEMAKSGGLGLIKDEDRNPFDTDTYGLGETIMDGLDKGIRKFIIFIGGSSTNDCGFGMLKALGYEFYDKKGNLIKETGSRCLNRIYKINDKKADERLKDSIFKVACDVNNPLYGENGASYIYAKQKGALEDELAVHDDNHKLFSKIVKDFVGIDCSMIPGAGAAGGLGFAFKAFFDAELINGADLVMDFLNLKEMFYDYDILVTGEGCFDKQSLMGKGPVKLCKTAKMYNSNIKTLLLCGCVNNNDDLSNDCIDGYFSIINMPLSAEQLMSCEISEMNLRTVVSQVAGMIL